MSFPTLSKIDSVSLDSRVSRELAGRRPCPRLRQACLLILTQPLGGYGQIDVNKGSTCTCELHLYTLILPAFFSENVVYLICMASYLAAAVLDRSLDVIIKCPVCFMSLRVALVELKFVVWIYHHDVNMRGSAVCRAEHMARA